MAMKRKTTEGDVRGPEIEDVWMFLGRDGNDREGILTCLDVNAGTMTPMIATDEARMKSLRETAQAHAKRLGQRIKLVRFHLRHDVEVFIP